MTEATQHAPGDALLEAYEDVPYVGRANRKSHPDRMATIATLLGMNPPPPASCRVLEIACGDGANLIPAAASLPGSRFVGFDFAPSGIERARRMAAQLGLANALFLTLDLRAVPEDFGEFDYIIAHGLYSWVPASIRRHLLPFVARHLARNGVAFVSYNTYPGCYVRRAMWEMLKYHARNATDHRARLAAARSLISLLADPVSTHDEGEAALHRELQSMGALTDSALAHDDLSEPNEPVYFHEFAAALESNRLAFLAEAEIHAMVGLGLTPRVRQALARMDRLTREQYLDFVHLRRYRESLVCHAGVLSRFVIDPARAAPMHASASTTLRQLAEDGKVGLSGGDADAHALKELLVSRWPHCVPVAELAAWHAGRRGARAQGAAIETMVVQAYGAGLLELCLQPPTVVAMAGLHPTAFAPARWQARDGDVVANVHHDAVNLNERIQRQLLPLLDGTRTRGQILAEMGASFADADRAGQLERVLDQLARAALLVA